MTEPDELARAAAILDAAIAFVKAIVPNADMYDDVTGAMGCTDVEALAALVRAAGYPGSADMLIEGHSWHDEEEDDLHYDPAKAEHHADLH